MSSWAQAISRPPPNGHIPFNQHSPHQPPRKINNPRVRISGGYRNNNSHNAQQIRPRQNNHSNNSNHSKPRYQAPAHRPHSNIGGQIGVIGSKAKHKGIKCIILDTGAFIERQNFFNNFGSDVQYFMTPAVNNEIRDKTSRQFLDMFPYEIVVRKPDPQSASFVSQFLCQNPALRSMSRTDRQVIALAHTLELEHEGPRNLKVVDSSVAKAQSTKDGQYVKKSKTGRLHTKVEPMKDTGVRLAQMKKVIPFHFDDFLTLDADQYGEKYGKPHPLESKIEDLNLLELSPLTGPKDVQSTPDIEKMMEEDIHTFNETESIISEISAHSKQLQLNGFGHHNGTINGTLPPKPLPPAPDASFGTMFTMEKGSIFGTTETEKVDTIDKKPVSPVLSPKVSNSTVALPPLDQKKTVDNAWNGEWISEDNLKIETRKKSNVAKVKAVPDGSNMDSKVAMITMDFAMQKAAVLIGLRVLSTSSKMRYGHRGNESNDLLFRCYGCFTMEHDTSRTTCRVCGGQTFQRVNVYIDERGKAHHHYSGRDRWGAGYQDRYGLMLRGNQYVKDPNNRGMSMAGNRFGGKKNRKKQKRKRERERYARNRRGGGQWR